MEKSNAKENDHFKAGIKFSVRGMSDKARDEYLLVQESDPNYKQAQANLKWLRYFTQHKSANPKPSWISAGVIETLAKHLDMRSRPWR